MRDDFSKTVKRALADRVSYRCSNPECRASTSGPQVRPDKALNVGVAAHISAATPGGPRYNPSLTAIERSDASNGVWLCQNCAKLVDNDESRYTEAILQDWKRSAERDALATIGRARARSRSAFTEQEREIKRNLALRDKMHLDFLKPLEERRRLGWETKPYQKFAHSEVLVRSIEDKRYPEVDMHPPSGISSWFKLELYDFYHNGLVVILGIERAIIDREGRWAIVAHDQPFDQTQYREIRVWRLGRIPWRNIRHYDLEGDEYYNFPHLFCAFADNGTPYEEVTFALLGDDYDWPLDTAQRFRYKPDQGSAPGG